MGNFCSRSLCPPSPFPARQPALDTQVQDPPQPGSQQSARGALPKNQRGSPAQASISRPVSNIFAKAAREKAQSTGVKIRLPNACREPYEPSPELKEKVATVFQEMAMRRKNAIKHVAQSVYNMRSKEGDVAAQQIAQIVEDTFDAAVQKTAKKRIIGKSGGGSLFSAKEADIHLEQFSTGAHAFISAYAFNKIINPQNDPDGWNRFGQDYNFVGTLSDADQMMKDAATGGGGISGIRFLEESYGIPEGKWSDDASESIYRFKVLKPKKFNIALSSGNEQNAYQNEWVAGAYTLGGQPEAIIDSMSREELKSAVASGYIQIEKVTFGEDGALTTENVQFSEKL